MGADFVLAAVVDVDAASDWSTSSRRRRRLRLLALLIRRLRRFARRRRCRLFCGAGFSRLAAVQWRRRLVMVVSIAFRGDELMVVAVAVVRRRRRR